VIVTLPDGTSTRTSELEYGSGHLRLEQSFDAQGEEVPGDRHYTISFDELSPLERGLLVEAFSGDPAAGLAAGEREGLVELSFSTEQLEALGERMRAYVEAEPTAFGSFIARAAIQEDPLQLALAVVRDTAGENTKAYELLRLSRAQVDLEHQNLPGQVRY
jgi:hypothetical protein